MGFPPAEGMGGPTKSVSNLVFELARRGHEVTVYCTNLHDKHRKIAPKTFERDIGGAHIVYFNTYTLPFLPGTIGPMWLPELNHRLRDEISQFDIVHVNGYRDFVATTVIRNALEAQIPYVIQPRGVLTYVGWTGYLKRVTDLWYQPQLKKASTLLALSQTEAEECLRLGESSVLVKLVRNGILIDEYLPLPPKGALRKRLGVQAELPIVLFLARLNWIKGPDILLRAFAHCCEEAVLAIVGPDNGYQSEITRLIQELNLTQRVKLVGAWLPARVMEAFVDADIFVMTSRKELFPMALVEACVAGVPAVISDTVEIASLVDGKSALVTPLDESAIAQSIDRLLSDAVLRRQFASNAPEIAYQEFSLQGAVDRLETIYQAILEQRNNSI